MYHPVFFFLPVLCIALAISPLEYILTRNKSPGRWSTILLLISLSAPCLMSLFLIYISHNEALQNDFWLRMALFNISTRYFLAILCIMPCVILTATALSLFFGGSRDQFSWSDEVSVMRGKKLLGVIVPLLLAPLLEEVGWRGYGVDSLRSHFTLFTTSLLFGLLWALWHLPVFFIRGYYHHQLLQQGAVYVINFFVSVVVVAFLINWIYYKTDRSIPAAVLFHGSLNLSSMALKTEQRTKCIVTVLLGLLALTLVVYEHDFFFSLPYTSGNGYTLNIIP